MAYPRRTSGSSYARNRASSDEDTPSLAPPRPFFLGDRSERTSSWSAASSAETSIDPASDSEREQAPPALPNRVPPIPTARAVPGRNHRRRSSMASATTPAGALPATAAGYAQVDAAAPESTVDHSDSGHWSPNSLYQDAPIPSPTTPGSSALMQPARPPPSSFAFPFQAYPGNPDPGTSIPGVSRRRSSLESVPGGYHPLSHSGSLVDLRKPYAPFMQHGDGSGSVTPPNGSSNSLYRNSAAGNMISGVDTGAGNGGAIPRTSSTQTFRAPFLSPASRPTSSLWAPPSYSQQLMSNGNGGVYSPNASSSALPYPALPKKAPLPSTRLAAPIAKSDKPWLAKPDPRARLSWWLTLFCIFIGIGGAAVLCWQGVASVQKIDPSRLCSVLNEDFSGSSLDESVWNREIELGGFGNGEFQMTTGDSDNLYLQNSQLYIHPTLTSDKVQNVLDGGNFTLQDCTRTDNRTACSASSSNSRGTVINPIQSARINTKGKKSIRYGKVEIKAKMPKGDWLWPAVWMLPENNTYGAWPASGEIDIVEGRGNGPDYPAQGSNFVRSTLNYGPIPAVIKQIFGWQSLKRSSFDKGFHVYGLEWDEQFMRFYVDTRLHAMLDLNLKAKKDSFWEKGNFPQTAQNGSAQVVVPNPYENRPNSAPFDQSFYLIINLAAGGTSGWFPDNKGNKPWFDGSLTAMRDFAKAQDSWLPTWPSSAEDRSFRIDYVKMWELC